MNHIQTYHRLIKQCVKKGEITIEAYRELEALDPKTDDDVSSSYDVLFEKAKEKQIQDIQMRIVKGAEMIDDEPDMNKRRQYVALYNQLLHKLQELS